MKAEAKDQKLHIKEPANLSPRITWLRDYYFKGTERPWNNEQTAWTTGTPWDTVYNEISYYIVPESYMLQQTIRSSYKMSARKVELHPDFWNWTLPERRAWFTREVMVSHLPKEVLPGDLIAGARFNVQCSLCLNKKESRELDKMLLGKKGARARVKWFHDHGYGNTGATSGHLIPDYERALKLGWKGIHADLVSHYNQLSKKDKKGPRGGQLRAMMTAATMARDLAQEYAKQCRSMAEKEQDRVRKSELEEMAGILDRVPWEPPQNFWEAIQALWLTHMLIMSDENYPGPGVSFGRIDQYLLPHWEDSLSRGMDREFAKEILKCFWVHCNTVYDSMIRTGNQGITS
jgi:formate C-acetyltransferase